MEIAHLQPLSLLDYPGKVSAVVWTVGCNLRCPFCYNAELVLPELGADLPRLPAREILARLQERAGFLDGVVVTGGEPTLHPDLPAFLDAVKRLGVLTKLDTNGTRPDTLRSLLEAGLVDYVALDVKAPFARYPEFTGLPYDHGSLPSLQGPLPSMDPSRLPPPWWGKTEERGIGPHPLTPTLSHAEERERAGCRIVPGVVARVRESLALVRDRAPDCEFRTTVAPGLTQDDLIAIAGEIRGARRYVLQPFFVPDRKRLVDETWRSRPTLASDTLRALLPELQKLVPTDLRS
jgi:pyruvate formate lyase activating enzyme